MREWLAETHGARFELIRHFLPGLRGEWARVGAGAAALVASSWMLLLAMLVFKYKKLEALGLTARMAAESTNDVLSVTAMCLCAAAVLTAALWQSVYPTRTDCLAMAGWPVRPWDLFVAKFAALVLAFAGFVAVVLLPLSLVLAGVTEARLFATLGTLAGACGTLFFGAVAMQGLLLQGLPPRWFERAMIWLQAGLAAGGIGGFQLAVWKGHVAMAAWRLGWTELGWAFLTALASFALSFSRYRRLVVEAPQAARKASEPWLVRVLSNDPREQAALGFLWATVTRSRVHRLAVLAYVGLALAWMARGAVQLLAEQGSVHEVQRLLLAVYPLGLTVLTVFSLRHLFAIPVELQANWVFQVTEREGRAAWLRAVERFVLCVGVAPMVGLGMVFVGWDSGWWTAGAWGILAFGLGAAAFELLFRGWRKMPFTCSYLPGKRPVVITCALFAALLPLLLTIAWVAHASATNPASFVVMVSLAGGAWRYLRGRRMDGWGTEPLVYQETDAREVETYDLAGDGTVVAQEQFQREWSAYLRDGDSSPMLRPLDEGETWRGRMAEWVRAFPQDIHFALRALRRNPGFAVAVALTLGLGLGLNGAFFTVFQAFLLRPLAVRDPGSLVSIDFHLRNGQNVYLQAEDFAMLRGESPAFHEMAANTLEGSGLDGQSSRVALVSGNFFSMLGVAPAMGSLLRPDDQSETLVLNHRTWQNRYGGAADIVGRRVLLNGVWFTVAGVAAPEFAGVAVGTVAMVPPQWARFGVGAPDCWVSMDVWNRLPGVQKGRVLGLVGRLRPEMTEARAAAIVGGQARRMTVSRALWERVERAELSSMDVAATWTVLRYSLPLLLAFALTMLVPCANAANLMLARATARQREFGTRLSLGASRGRLVRQLLTEGLFLAALATMVGVAVSRVALDGFSRWIFATAPPTVLHRLRIPELTLDPYVWTYMALLTVVTAVLFALAPAAQSSRVSVTPALRGELGGWRASSLRDGLVVTQVALCVMLLAASGVLLTGTRAAAQIERGFDTTGVFGVGNESAEDARAMEEILRQEPWVDTVAVMGRPLNEAETMTVNDGVETYYARGSGEFFRLVRVGVVRGRVFTRDEGDRQEPVAVVSELAARALWPGQDPIGKTVRLGETKRPRIWRPQYNEARVVGVCRDLVVRAKDGGPRPMVYFPDKLRPGTVIAVRGKGNTDQTRALMNQAMARSPGAQHGAWLVALHETVDFETYPQQAVSWLATILGGVALLLTISGVYGVMQFLVSQRYREIGIRMALGATTAQVARFTLSYAGRLGSIGTACGVLLAVGSLQFLGSRMELLVRADDWRPYVVSLGVACVAALLALAGPTRRACRVDPQEALRMD